MDQCSFQCEKLMWVFWSTYLDENSRQGKYYKVTNVDLGKYYNMYLCGHTTFQPT